MKAPFSALALITAAIITAAIIAMLSPCSVRGDAPPPDGGGHVWCTTQNPGMCTLGIRQDYSTDEIDAYMFEHKCMLLNSTDKILTESNLTFLWPGLEEYSQAGNIYVHDITGEDEFWYDGALFQAGWSFTTPLPVYYEYRAFECGIYG